MIATHFEQILENKEEKGIEKGRIEGILQTAKLMKDGGLHADQIKKFTGLSDEAIENL